MLEGSWQLVPIINDNNKNPDIEAEELIIADNVEINNKTLENYKIINDFLKINKDSLYFFSKGFGNGYTFEIKENNIYLDSLKYIFTIKKINKNTMTVLDLFGKALKFKKINDDLKDIPLWPR